MANSVDPDQTAPLGSLIYGGGVSSASTLCAHPVCPKTLDHYGNR